MKLTGGSTQNRLRIFAVWAVVVVVAAGAWLAARPASAAVVFKAASTKQNSTGTQALSMSYPPGVASGDLLIAIVTARGGTETTVSVAKPWNAIPGGAADSGTLITSRMFYTVYSSGSMVTFNILNNAGSQKVAGVMVAYSGVDINSPIDIATSVAKASASTMAANAVTTTKSNTLLLTAFSSARNTTFTAGAGNTMRGTTTTTGGNATTNVTVGLQDYNTIQANPGLSAAPTMAAATAAAYIAHTVAINPAPPPRVIGQSSHALFTVLPDGSIGGQLAGNTIAERNPFSLRTLLSVDGQSLAASGGSYRLQAAEKNGTCSVYADVAADSLIATTLGPRSPTAYVIDTSSGTNTWTNPEQVYTDDGLYASTYNLNPGSQSSYLLTVSSFGFNVPPNATIRKVTLGTKGYWFEDGAATFTKVSGNLALRANGRSYGQSDGLAADFDFSKIMDSYAYDANQPAVISELTPASVNAADFGMTLAATFIQFGSDGSDLKIDHMWLTVEYAVEDPTGGTLIFQQTATPASGSQVTAVAGDPSNGRPVVLQNYVRSNNFSNNQAVPVGSDGLWDMRLVAGGQAVGKTYCFRVVNSTGAPLDTYALLPEVTVIAGGPTLEQQLRGGQAVREGSPDTPLVAPGTSGW